LTGWGWLNPRDRAGSRGLWEDELKVSFGKASVEKYTREQGVPGKRGSSKNCYRGGRGGVWGEKHGEGAPQGPREVVKKSP